MLRSLPLSFETVATLPPQDEELPPQDEENNAIADSGFSCNS